jgi:hypothetical protein
MVQKTKTFLQLSVSHAPLKKKMKWYSRLHLWAELKFRNNWIAVMTSRLDVQLSLRLQLIWRRYVCILFYMILNTRL